MGVSRQEQTLAAAALVESLQPDAPIGFCVFDDELRFTLVSDSLATINGRPAREHLGRRVGAILPPQLAAGVETALRRVRETGEAVTGVEFDGITPARPGEKRTWVANYFPMTLQGRRMIGAVVVDVTERRRAEEELVESERLLSGAQEMASLGWWIWTAEPEETVTYAPELLAQMGRDPALGGTPHRRDLMEVADLEELLRVRRELRAALERDVPYAGRVRARRADGEIRLLAVRADPVHGEDRRPVALQGFLQDITDLARVERRQRTVADLGQAALAGVPLEELIQRAVDVTHEEAGVDSAAILQLSPDGKTLQVLAVAPDGYAGPRTVARSPDMPSERALRTRQAVIVEDLEHHDVYFQGGSAHPFGARSGAVVVIGGRGRPFGVLSAMSRKPGVFAREDASYLQGLANVIADAVERRTAEAEVAELSAARGRLVGQALDAEERARRRISETLHDGALQELLAARVDLFALSGRGGDEAALDDVQQRLGAIIRRLREVMSALHPTVLQYGGLEAALHAVADEQGGAGGFETRVEVDAQAVGARDPLLLSVARELLTNVARHAGATRAEVAVRREHGDLVLDVSDDGAGMPPGRPESAVADGRVGLASCRERMEAVGGSLRLEAAAMGGLRVHARAPAATEATQRRAGAGTHGGPADPA